MMFSRAKKVLCRYPFMIGIISVFGLVGLSCLVFALQQPSTAETYATYPTVTPNPNFSPELVKQGEYIVKAGDCLACHTNVKENGKPFAGGLAFVTPFGTFYSQNITPDKQYGIGNWTDQQLIKAMRHGLNPEGANYFPVFPYTSFNWVREDDIKAIRAYLMSIPAVHQPNKEPDAIWPFNWRFAQWGWKLLFYRDNGPYKDDPAQTPEWNRGAYLVKGLVHCGECHTPRNFLGGLKHKYDLTGAMVNGYYAPNISGPALKNYSVDDIVNVLMTGRRLNGRGYVAGPMAEATAVGLKYLTKADLRAMAVYIKTVNSEQPKVNTGGAAGPEEAKELYKNHCAVCHDVGAAGAPKLNDTAAWENRIKLGKESLYNNAINGINSMPAMGACPSCSQNDIKAIVDYMVGQVSGAIGTGTSHIPAPKALTIEDGQRIYETNCASCHAPGSSQQKALNAPALGDESRWTAINEQNIDVLVEHTVNGYRAMPANGGCKTCSVAEIKASVKYMAQKGQKNKDFSLW